MAMAEGYGRGRTSGQRLRRRPAGGLATARCESDRAAPASGPGGTPEEPERRRAARWNAANRRQRAGSAGDVLGVDSAR